MTLADDPQIDLEVGPEDVLQNLLEMRYSCRAFQHRRVPRPTIRRILELAQRSPSWCNTQPWEVFVTEGAGTERFRTAISAFAAKNPPCPDLSFPERYEGIFQHRRRECGWQLYESVGIEHGDRVASAAQMQRNFTLFNAPHVAIITTERDLGVYGALDCGVYLSGFLLAAQSLGVSAIPQAALAAVAPAVRDQLQLPDHRQVLYGVSFGYSDHQHPANHFRTTRAEIEDVVSWIS
jgi:nitroreductase